MSENVWAIGQKLNAQEYFKQQSETTLSRMCIKMGDLFALTRLTNVCEQMSETFDEITDDQTAYEIELEKEGEKLNTYCEDIEEKIKALQNEIAALEKKQENGTITDEEKEELKQKQGELITLSNNSSAEVKSKSDALSAESEKVEQGYRSKIKVAENYANTTIEKGTPFAATKVSHGFFKKLFGNTGKGKKVAGEKAVTAGNNLMEKVVDAKNNDEDIKSLFKSYKK